MKIRIAVTVICILTTAFSYGQNELSSYKKTYRIADSLNALGKINRFDSTIFKVADSLGHFHPAGYFQTAAKLLNESKFNEAAFIYYVGLIRFRYYNSANPDYQPSGDGALLASFKSVLGDRINMYQRINIDNFISVLKMVTKYTAENDYSFYSRSKNIDKYNEQTEKYNVLIVDLETNKEKYSANWKADRIEFEKKIDTLIEEQKEKEKTEDKTNPK